MTDRTRKTILFALVPVLGAALLTLGARVWGMKVDTSTFNAHVQGRNAEWALHLKDDEQHRQLDSLERKANADLLLDVLCGVKPGDRRCR